MSREDLEKRRQAAAEAEKDKPPFKTPSEGQLHIVNSIMNPKRERIAEFSNIKESMVFGMSMSYLRERAADPRRNRLVEPLSEVMRFGYCVFTRGVGFKLAMLGGNVALGITKNDDSGNDMGIPRIKGNM